MFGIEDRWVIDCTFVLRAGWFLFGPSISFCFNILEQLKRSLMANLLLARNNACVSAHPATIESGFGAPGRAGREHCGGVRGKDEDGI